MIQREIAYRCRDWPACRPTNNANQIEGQSVDFEHSQKVKDLQKRLSAFMDEHIYPNEERFFREAEEVGPMKVAPVIEEVKLKGKAAGLWNLFLPPCP